MTHIFQAADTVKVNKTIRHGLEVFEIVLNGKKTAEFMCYEIAVTKAKDLCKKLNINFNEG